MDKGTNKDEKDNKGATTIFFTLMHFSLYAAYHFQMMDLRNNPAVYVKVLRDAPLEK